MKFKEFPKKYENILCDESMVQQCDLSKIDIEGGVPLSEYIKSCRAFMKEVSDFLFDFVVKFKWVHRRFYYNGNRKKKQGGNFYTTDGAFAVLMRNYIGTNHWALTNSFFFGKVYSYLDDFFPDFDEGNPFIENDKYKFPYKNITIDFLTVVYQMPERLELLEIAENKQMSYAEFVDYVVNYVYCYNEESKRGDTYTLVYDKTCPPYIKYNLK